MPRNKDAGEGRVPSSPSGAASFFTCPGWSGHPDALLKSVHQGRCLCLCLLQDSDEWRDRLSGGKRHVSTHIRRSSKGTVMASQDSALMGISTKLHTLVFTSSRDLVQMQVWGGARESAFYQTAGDVSVACTKGLLLCLCLPDIKAAMLSPQIFLPVIYLGSYCGL